MYAKLQLIDTMDEIQKIKSLLQDQDWRLFSWKLYKIVDKNWKLIPFEPNKAQKDFYDNMHNLNIIVKARQKGFSTFIQIYLLDQVLFKKNWSVWIIAQDHESAINIFKNKIKVAFDNLPSRLKSYYIVRSDRANEISFENTWSKIRVATSFRSDTLQWLHISEYWKICAKYPLNAKEIKEGSLEAVGKWNFVCIESTAEWWEWLFYEMSKKAKEIQDTKRQPNEMEWKLLFSPRRDDIWYEYDWDVLITQEEADYFDKLDWMWIKVTRWQKNRYVLKRREKWDGMMKEYPSTFDEAFQLTLKGSYYEKNLTLARQQWRIWSYPYNPWLQVHTARDLWWSWWWDDTSCRFFQLYDNKIYIIDYLEWNWYWRLEKLSIVQSKKYNFGRWIWPQDIMNNNEWETKRHMAKKIGITFERLPMEKSLNDWIELVRTNFHRMHFDEQKCAKWLNRLSVYRRSRDEANWVRRDRPQHNWASHAADALRYLCRWLQMADNERKVDVISMNFNI